MKKTGIVDKDTAKEVLDEVLSKDKYRNDLDKADLKTLDKLNMINGALADMHIGLVGSGKVSVAEAKNFRHFVKKQFEVLIGSKRGKGEVVEPEKVGDLLSDVVWSAYNAYARYKLEQIKEIQKKKAARVKRILDRRR